MKEFTAGQWIQTEEGVGQVISTHDLYVEEYSPDFLEGKKEIGELLVRVCVYKILSDYQGKIRKRKIIITSNIEYCDPISNEYKRIINKIIHENPAAFNRFMKLECNKNLYDEHRIFFQNRSHNIESLKAGIDEINQELNKPFVFKDFKMAVKKHGLDIDFAKANKNPDLRPPDFYISLFNENYAIRNKQALFTKVQITINDWHSENSSMDM
ncbi:MAG: hypothetical protein ABW090_03180 [Sedimenticola sp.]